MRPLQRAQWIGRFLSVIVFLTALTACAGGIFPTYFHDDAVDKPGEIAAAADWDKAQTIVIDMRQNTFTPAVVHLNQGRPYVLVLENRDDVTHLFAAKEFFRTTAIQKIVSDDEEEQVHRLSTVKVGPGEVKEVYLIPLRDGWYPFEGADPGFSVAGISLSPFSRGAIQGMVGNFVVEP